MNTAPKSAGEAAEAAYLEDVPFRDTRARWEAAAAAAIAFVAGIRATEPAPPEWHVVTSHGTPWEDLTVTERRQVAAQFPDVSEVYMVHQKWSKR